MGACLVSLSLGDGLVTARIAHRDEDELAARARPLRRRAPRDRGRRARGPRGVLGVGGGPLRAVSSASSPCRRGSEIRGNYSARTRHALETLVSGFVPEAPGQLLLWTGEPGTGKTHAVRALAWEWREWCRLHYITDPEQLLGQRSRYLLDVLLAEDEGVRAATAWRLLLMEDTGEMLSADAKERAGQGLSRLLNVVDGLIGQGLRILVMITTNERVGALHPAVVARGPVRRGARVRSPAGRGGERLAGRARRHASR